MGLKDTPKYELTIDDQYADDGEYLGIVEIANTANPAILLKGIAFSKQEKKTLQFKDDLKYRIAAPVLIPSDIPRIDPNTNEQYIVTVTPETVEAIFVKFMKDRAGQDVFNEEHDESKRVPSYILETWMVENPKQDKSFTTYGIEVPEKTWFAVQQFTDKDAYKEAVEKGQTGFSIHGEGALKFAQIKKQIQMKKRKFVAQMSEAVGTDAGEIIVTTDEQLVEGAEVVVMDENFQPVDDFTGVVVVEDETIKIENDVITEVTTTGETVEMEEKEEVEMTEEKEEIEATETTEEVEATEEEVAEAKVEMMTEEQILSVVQPKMDEIYEMIAEIKAMVSQTAPVEAEEEEVTYSKADIIMSQVEKIAKMKNK
jgi:hypothetical protein